ncbi:MAG: hypothetical protein JW827_06950 [Spirochaetes bacterium]|nr:hypothetical protein [Spirochaetota bacterium]
MDDENKVKAIVESKKSFLKDVFRALEDKPKVYDLQEEFAKTRYNRNYKFYIFVFAFIAALIFFTILITSYVNYRSTRVTFQISEFEDVNLSELLDTVKKNEKKLKDTKQEMANIHLELEKKIQTIRKKYAARKEAVYQQDLDSDEEKEKIASINTRENKDIAKIRSQYKSTISSKQQKMTEIQNDINQYDRQLQEATRKAEEMLNNYKRLHKIKMEQQRKELTLKYNPWFHDPALKDVVYAKFNPELNKTIYLRPFEPDVEKKKVFTVTEFNTLRKEITGQSLIIKRLRKVPYENSVAPALAQLEYLTRSIINKYERLWSSLARKTKLLNNYNYAFSHLARVQSETGYIIDPSDEENILVFVPLIHDIKPGDQGLVFRTDDDYIGRVEFFAYEGEIRAKVIEMEEKKTIDPFDKILIKKE